MVSSARQSFKWQCQVCWWEQKFSGSDKCIGGNRSSVAVASVLMGTEVQWQWQLCLYENLKSGSKCSFQCPGTPEENLQLFFVK